MSKPGKDSDRSLEVQKSFDRMAGKLDLRLEPAAGPGQVRHVGKMFGFSNRIEVASVEGPAAPGAADDAAIAEVVKGAASLHPAQVPGHWREYYNDPTEAIGRNFVSRMNQKTIHTWGRSRALARMLKDYPPYSPRQVEITDLRIVYIGGVRAAVTYHLEERFQNGKVAAGNASALLVRLAAGWRILVFTSDELIDAGK